jgi:hypothetical protein
MNTRSLLLISFAVGLGAAGCGSDVKATASGVFPAEGFAGRSLRVEVSGDQTNWKDGATVDFGAGVTVNSVDVASPTDLFADITIDPTATFGKNDVTVSSGGKYTLKSAFEIVSPIELQIQGNLAQGSIGVYKIINHDFDNPFDGTQAQDPQTGATVYPNLNIVGPTGVDLMSPAASQSFAVSAYEIDGLILMDVDATSGAVTVTSGPSMKSLVSTSDALTIATRSASDASSGSTSGMITKQYDSQLYKLATGTAPALVRTAVTTQSTTAAPDIAVLGPSGHWSDFLAVGPSNYGVAVDAGASYAIVYDLSGASSYTYALTSSVETIMTANEGADATNGTTNGATVLNATALPFMQLNGKVSSAADVDIIKVVVATGSPLIGKVFHVTTLNGSPDPYTSLTVDVAAGTASITQSGNPEATSLINCVFGGVCGVDFTTDSTKPIAVGTYYVKIAAGADWAAADTDYTILFWTE